MLFLLAVSAQAQSPYYGGNNIYAGTPAPVYTGYQSPQSYYMPPPAVPAVPVVPAAPAAPSNPAFDLSQMNRQVDAARYQALGHNLFYTTPLATLFPDTTFTGNVNAFGQYGNYLKAKGSQIDEHRLDRQINYYRATHPAMTITDQNKVDDLILQREAARNSMLRRAVSIIPHTTIPGAGPVSVFFDARAQQDNVQLAKNTLFDARQTAATATAPSQTTVVALRNARDNVDQAQYRREGSTLDLLGNSFGGAGKLGPVFRKKASQEKLDVGYRNLRVAQDAYAKDPSEDNRLNLKLANLFIRATSQEDDANTDDVLVASAFPLGSVRGLIAGKIASSKNFQDESNLWLKYNRLQRQILIRKQQEQLQSSNANPVAQQMLALQNYGPNPSPNQGPGTNYPNDRSTLSGAPNS